jgi:DeoR family transcriptional regulator of aga operon
MNYGISTTNLEEAALNKKMIDAAQKVIVLADASKFGKKSFAKICGLSAIDEIITDQEISKTFRKKLLENEVKITVVGTR